MNKYEKDALVILLVNKITNNILFGLLLNGLCNVHMYML